MLTRRSLVKHGGLAALATAAPAFVMRTAWAQAATFDYYIGPNGSDSNPGTLANPWSITALNNNRSTYAGKRVGILPGTYSVYSLCQANDWNAPALGVNGGTSGSSTYIASCNSDGNYAVGTVTLSALDPSGAQPTNACGIIGQGAAAPPANWGFVTLDGLQITGSNGCGVWFYTTGAGAVNGAGGPQGIVVQNCKIYNITGTVNDNVAGIYLQSCTGALIHNCLIYGVQPPTNGGNPQDVAGIYTYYCLDNIYEYNTIYNCNQGVRDKFYPNGGATLRYNYIEINGFAPVAALGDGNGGNAGTVYTVHHNIFNVIGAGGALWYVNVWPNGKSSNESLVFYNNTCIFPNGGNGLFYPSGGSNVTPNATVTHYNNVYLPGGVPNYEGIMAVVAGAIQLSDYNLYGTVAAVSGYLTVAPYSAPGAPSNSYTLNAWQSALGVDAHSHALDATFMNPISLNPIGFALVAGTPGSASGSSPGSTTGTSDGTACDMGAWGGESPPAQIGSNLSLIVPNPPVLNVS